MGDVGDDIEDDFEKSDENKVDGPGTFGIDPFRVEVGQGGLVTDVLQ